MPSSRRRRYSSDSESDFDSDKSDSSRSSRKSEENEDRGDSPESGGRGGGGDKEEEEPVGEPKPSQERQEAGELLEKLSHVSYEDPVFDGMSRDFQEFDRVMNDVNTGVLSFMKGVGKLCEGLQDLSEAVVKSMAKNTDELIAADAVKFREATHLITRTDAPHSAVAKLKRDLDFNIGVPLKAHLENNEKLKMQIVNRRNKLNDLKRAKGAFERVLKNDKVGKHDKAYIQAEMALENARQAFQETDRSAFEWLHMLEEYRLDIYDSTTQTLKYLQYEFFASSAHAVSHVLPARMEFRPMIEMTPDQLEPQVLMELEDGGDVEGEGVKTVDATNKILDKWEKSGAFAETAEPDVPADPMNLSVLLAQGFEEGPARKALRKHNNDCQKAMDWLLDGCPDDKKPLVPADSVRMPSTLARVQRMREKRRKEREKEREREKDEAQASGRGSRRSARREREKEKDGERGKDRDRDREGTGENSRKSTNGAAGGGGGNLLDLDDSPPVTSKSREKKKQKDEANLEDLLGLDEEPPPPMTLGDYGQAQPAAPPSGGGGGAAASSSSGGGGAMGDLDIFGITPLPEKVEPFNPANCTLSKDFGSPPASNATAAPGLRTAPPPLAPPASGFSGMGPGPGSMPSFGGAASSGGMQGTLGGGGGMMGGMGMGGIAPSPSRGGGDFDLDNASQKEIHAQMAYMQRMFQQMQAKVGGDGGGGGGMMGVPSPLGGVTPTTGGITAAVGAFAANPAETQQAAAAADAEAKKKQQERDDPFAGLSL